MSERAFLQGYDASAYPAVAVTVDVALLTLREGRLCVLLVERGEHPFRGSWALPGGFVRPAESLDDAAARELREETGVEREAAHLEQLGSYGDPGRDPRMRVVSVAYIAIVPDAPDPQAGTDARSARYWPVEDLATTGGRGRAGLAFDHARILGDAVERVRAKLEYSPIGASFCEQPFTVADLRRVYEAVWGHPLDPGNFQRKVLGTPGFVEPTVDRSASRASGGRRARLYRSGRSVTLHPPILRHAPGEPD
ncbi:MutT/NUDIX hydrolase [Paraconexibacter sp. AEG42_29]|uniref:MutT/NUDIX hydrolase n=1 Tax=Paraconexibacter sp. AEG42_29 TaxID=2997339 RepID=A0AAU7AUN5_9ACTN